MSILDKGCFGLLVNLCIGSCYRHMVKPFKAIPKIIVEGRKGGSNLAATLCNAILTFDDAEQLKPGRDL